MDERPITRRRFVSLAGAFALTVLVGCTDAESDDEGGGVGDEEPDAEEEDEAEAIEEAELPEIEGTNLFIEVVDEEEGTPVPGITVTVTGGAYDEEAFETDAAGGVVLENVEPDDYTITAKTEKGEDEAEVSLEEGEDANVSLEVPAPEGRDEDGAEEE